MMLRTSACGLLLLAAACVSGPPVRAGTSGSPAAPGAVASAILPVVDHHKHLMSPVTAEWGSTRPLRIVELPPALARVLRARTEAWNDENGLATLLTDSVLVLDSRAPEWIRGRADAAEFLSGLFARQYRITPVDFRLEGSSAYVTGYYSRDIPTGIRHFGHALLTLTRGSDGEWRIAAESPTFPGPTTLQPLTADMLLAELDSSGIQRALVHSLAYWFGSRHEPAADEYARVRAENDWTAAEAARSGGRLIAFCSFNPLREYALEELDRCARHPHMKGLKLHLGNSRVEVLDPVHIARLREVFRAANDRRLPVAIHLWTSRGYEQTARESAEAFLNEVLPAAPDVVVQIAHFAGGGPGYTDLALGVYAEAIAAGDPRTRNLYFDIATVADRQPAEVLRTFAARIRQVGVERVLWGSDMSPPNPSALSSWENFMKTVPLSEDEFRTIAGNVAPFLR